MAVNAHTLAFDLAPALQEILRSHRADIIMEAGGPLRQFAAKAAFPSFVGMVPSLLESGIELLAHKFGGMKLEEVAEALVAIRTASPGVGVMLEQGGGIR